MIEKETYFSVNFNQNNSNSIKKEDRFSVLFLFSRLFSATKRKREGQKIIFRFERKNRENNRKNQLDFVTKKTPGILSEK